MYILWNYYIRIYYLVISNLSIILLIDTYYYITGYREP